METIQKYRAIDGREFLDMDECIKHEQLIEEVNVVMSVLPTRPASTEFVNGCGYIQHDKNILGETKIKLLKICQRYIQHQWIFQTMEDETIHPNWVYMLLGEYGITPLTNAWHRFVCIDSKGREWGQPFWVQGPTNKKNI